MKGLNTLIKLHKRTLDDLRRKLVGLEEQKAQLQALSRTLQEELEREMQMATAQPDLSRFFSGFAKRIQKRQEDIAREMQALDRQIAALSEQIAEAFGELKKFEIAQENALRRLKEEEKRRDDALMDDIAARQHRRKEEGQ